MSCTTWATSVCCRHHLLLRLGLTTSDIVLFRCSLYFFWAVQLRSCDFLSNPSCSPWHRWYMRINQSRLFILEVFMLDIYLLKIQRAPCCHHLCESVHQDEGGCKLCLKLSPVQYLFLGQLQCCRVRLVEVHLQVHAKHILSFSLIRVHRCSFFFAGCSQNLQVHGQITGPINT